MQPTLSLPTGPSRLRYLDGLRGWMALIVVFSHLFRVWLLDPPTLAAQGGDGLSFWFKWTPLGLLTDGLQAVYIFFVVSGVALSYPILRSARPDRTLLGMAVYRYPRLTVPILASSLIAWVLLSSGAFRLHEIARHQANAAWWLELYDFPARFPAMLKYALWNVYTPDPPNRESWNIVLWTMPIELQGSFLIFALLAIVRWRWLRIPLAGAVAIHEVGAGIYGYLVGFLVGYLLAELILVLERRPAVSDGRASRIAGWVLFAAGLACSIRLQVVSFDRPRSDYMMAMNIVATLVVSGVVLTSALHRWLSGPISHFLGRISFGLYLTHFLVICSFSSTLYLALIDVLPYGLVVALVGGLSLPAALAAGYAFTLLVEEGALPRIKRPLRAAASRSSDLAYSFVRSSVLRILP